MIFDKDFFSKHASDYLAAPKNAPPTRYFRQVEHKDMTLVYQEISEAEARSDWIQECYERAQAPAQRISYEKYLEIDMHDPKDGKIAMNQALLDDMCYWEAWERSHKSEAAEARATFKANQT